MPAADALDQARRRRALHGAEAQRAVALDERDRAGAAAEHGDRLREDARQQVVEIERRGQLLLDLVERVELALAALEVAARALQLLVLRHERVVEPRVVDRDRGLARERAEQLLVGLRERTVVLVEDLQHADHAADRVQHRHREDSCACGSRS